MIWSTLLTLLATAPGCTHALPKPQGGPTVLAGGTGPFAPATYTTTRSLPRHTLYHPATIPDANSTAGFKLPLLVWGNGACGADGTAFEALLTQVASHGVLVVANGTPGGGGQSEAEWMREAIEWAVAVAAGGGAVGEEDAKWAGVLEVDGGRIAVAGQSCGGLEAYEVAAGDERVGALGIFNSGMLDAAEAQRVVPGLRLPVFYFLGGPSDIAFQNGERDYDLLAEGTPSWKGNLDVGHDGTYWEPDAGRFGVAAVRFVQWLLRGNETAAEFFTGGQEAAAAGWEVESKNLEAITVTPI
ncbi:hypothetical protein VTK26DRAFT_9113 [Humicola hyalothermophila]